MPGTSAPQHGPQSVWAQFQGLVTRITNLETWQRQVTPVGARVAASAALVLTTGATAIPGVSYTIPVAGSYMVVGTFDVWATASGYNAAVGEIEQNGVPITGQAILGDTGGTGRWTIGQAWFVPCNAGDLLQALAWKTAAGGTVQTNSGHTGLTIARVR